MTKRGYKTPKGKSDATDQPIPEEKPVITLPSLKLIKPGLNILRENLEVTIIISLLPSLLVALGRILVGDGTVIDNRALLGTLILLAAVTWLFSSLAALYYMQLRAIIGGHPGIIESYRNSLRYLPRVIGLTLLVSSLVIIGLFLLVVPGILLYKRYFLAHYFLVDEDLGIREAMARSAAATSKASSAIYGVLAIMAAVAVISFILAKLWPAYGGTISVLLGCVYTFLPALRYKEIALRKSALESL